MTIATINMVVGDNLPLVSLKLIDRSNGSPVNVSAATVNVLFRPQGQTGGTPITCSLVTDGTDGMVQFSFPSGVTDVTPGMYEGEIVITYTGAPAQQQTVYDTLLFRIRAA